MSGSWDYCPTKKTKKVEKAQKSYADVVSVSVKDSSSNANVTVEQDEDNYKLETWCIESEEVVSLEIEKNNDNNAKSEKFESISHVTNHSNVEDQNT